MKNKILMLQPFKRIILQFSEVMGKLKEKLYDIRKTDPYEKIADKIKDIFQKRRKQQNQIRLII